MASTMRAASSLTPVTASTSSTRTSVVQAPRTVPRSTSVLVNSKALRFDGRLSLRAPIYDRLKARAVLGLFGSTETATETSTSSITEEELAGARKAWGDALVAVSKAFEEGGIVAATKVANGALDGAYGYNLGEVLFKPTLASGEQTFRPTKEGALAYFVGHSDDYPNDGGFGIKGWRTAEFVTAAQFMDGDVGIWQGNGIFTDKDGNVTTVDKTFGYKKDSEGNLRIVLHHSSLPYSAPTPPVTEEELAAARQVWGDALVAVSKAYEEGGISSATEVANGALDAAYGYNMGEVCFKPTLAFGKQTFRPTKEGALAYFVGHSKAYPQDGGFGIKGWRKAKFDTAAQFMEGNVGIWQGNGTFTDKEGKVTKVDKTFGYKKDDEGNLRIVLHHSSLPYDPNATKETAEERSKRRWKAWDAFIKEMTS